MCFKLGVALWIIGSLTWPLTFIIVLIILGIAKLVG